MRATTFVLIICIVFLFSAIEARKCKTTKVCSKAVEKCVKRRTEKRCVKFRTKTTTTHKKTRICTKINAKAKCAKCISWKTKRTPITKRKETCAKRRTIKHCIKTKRVCKKHKQVKQCTQGTRKPRILGRATCPAGQTVKFSRVRKNTVRRTCVKKAKRSKPVFKMCSSYLDPHTAGFDRRHYEFQFEGDFLMAKSADNVFVVHQRLRRFGGFTGTVGMAVQVNGRDTVEYKSGQAIKVNGKAVGNSYKFPRGGSVTKKGNTIIVVAAGDYGRVVYTDFRNMANMQVFMNAKLKTEGYCNGAKAVAKQSRTFARGLFGKVMKVRFAPRSTKPHVFSAKQTRIAKQRCNNAKFKGAALRNCTKDILLASRMRKGMGKIFIQSEAKEVKLEKRARKQAKKAERKAKRANSKKTKKSSKRSNRKAKRRKARKAKKQAKKANRRKAKRANSKKAKKSSKNRKSKKSRRARRQAKKARRRATRKAVRKAVRRAVKKAVKRARKASRKATRRAIKRAVRKATKKCKCPKK